MDHAACVALLDADDNSRARTVADLTAEQFHVCACKDLMALYRALDAGGVGAVLIQRRDHGAALVDALVADLRATYPYGIAVAASAPARADRIRLLDAGADLCLDTFDAPTETAALLRALIRRTGPRHAAHGYGYGCGPGAGPGAGSGADQCADQCASRDVGLDATLDVATGSDGGPAGAAAPAHGFGAADRSAFQARAWQLHYQGWLLRAPSGTQIQLTGLERQFFRLLIAHPQRELSRHALTAADPSLNFKSISVAISRLRKKVGDTGTRLPLHTVQGVGYVFVGLLCGSRQAEIG